MSFADRILEKRHRFATRLGWQGETARATQYWAALRSYHKSNEEDPIARRRSEFIADVLVPELGLSSLLEVGTNTGRNLGIVKQRHPAIRAKGLDVNRRALEQARDRYRDVEFVLQDANRWTEPPRVVGCGAHDVPAGSRARRGRLTVGSQHVQKRPLRDRFELWDRDDGD